jgi:serine/threonine protein kinase
MSTYTSEPGTRLAGRYRLVDQTSGGTGWTYWKATDETLARPVAVLTFATGFPRINEVVTAARAASRLNDARFAQVFDVEDSGEIAYVVLEWVRGESLADMLAEGPLDPRRAAAVMLDAARALATAHRSGQSHMHLDPACLHWTPGGGAKIRGLGIDAALAGPSLSGTDSPELADARGLGKLLYASLTGYWPGPDGVLPPGPLDPSGVLCTPRQVSAGVPAGLDALTCRALLQQDNRQGPAIETSAAFADALTQVAPAPMVEPASFPTAAMQPARSGGTAPQSYRRRHPVSERSAVNRSLVGVVIVVVLLAIAVGGWAISRSVHQTPAAQASHPQQSTGLASSAASVVLKPVNVSIFNLAGTPDDPADAPNIMNPGAGTSWHTQYYVGNPKFGGLKTGVGLLLDMGGSVKLSSVTVQFGTTCCTAAQIEIGASPTVSQANLASFTSVQSSTTAAGATTFNVTSSATGRYVLIWITSLPPLTGQSDHYEAWVYDVTVRGTST